MSFVHLRVHTEYSLVDGIVRLRPLVAAVAQAGMPAVAVTEQGNLFSMVKFYRAAVSSGVKPILGVELPIMGCGAARRDSRAASSEPSAVSAQSPRMVLLCKNKEGFSNLSRLVTRSYAEGQVAGVPHAHFDWVARYHQGLIALSGGRGGDVGLAILAGLEDEAEARLEAWLRIFGDRYYVELQRTGRDGEREYNAVSLDLAAHHGVPVVATNDVCFLDAGDFEAHEARVCIHEGRGLADPRRERRHSEQQFLRTPGQMAELFADCPEALENTLEVAKRCTGVLPLGETHLPNFPLPPEAQSAEAWLEREAQAGLAQRIGTGRANKHPEADYQNRLDHELAIINQMGFASYFLIVADFIRWAREQDIPVGPGRGSGAGSLVAYALRITDLDPLEFELIFERFLNPERVSLPDFDIDFCMEGRDRVIEYVSEHYGQPEVDEQRVAQIITFGTMAAKAVVRDVGRVLGHPYGYVDQLAKLIPFELGITLERALQEEALKQRYDDEEEVRTLFDLASKLEGVSRNAGRHAGGVVIAPRPLCDFTPLYCEQSANGVAVVTQLDKDDVQAIGLVKFDFLGLRTLTIIDRALKSINHSRRAGGEDALDLATIVLDDAATFDLIKRGATTAVFQLESRGMKDIIRRVLPDRFDDIIALVALFRPGPLQSGMVEDFIDRKHGRAEVKYSHPELAPILCPTYGVILYQEQVMQIAQVLAGYTSGGADFLRQAMGKKKPEEMAKQREIFMRGAATRGVEEGTATIIFDLMEKFAGYGFNKSHSAAYALISYQTAWLKTHYPAAFMAAVLSSDMDSTDKIMVFIEECKELDLNVLAPTVNESDFAFQVVDERTIRYGLGAVKGVGENAVNAILAHRQAKGRFKDLFDFVARIDVRRVGRRAIESLIRAGALDGLGPSRASMMATLSVALQSAEQQVRDRDAGQNDLFGGAQKCESRSFLALPEWGEAELLGGEKETLGLYFSGHPIRRYESELLNFVSGRLAELRPRSDCTQVVAGFVVNLRSLSSRKGRMAIVTLDDRTARVDAVVYSELYQAHRDILVKDRLLVMEGTVSVDDYTGQCSMTVTQVADLAHARSRYANFIRIRLDKHRIKAGMLNRLDDALKPFRNGGVPLCIDYYRDDAWVRLPLGAQWKITPSDEALGRMEEVLGEPGVVQVDYAALSRNFTERSTPKDS